MTPQEWREVSDEVQALWGKSPRWAQVTQVYRYAQGIPVQAAMQAVEQLYLEQRKMTPAPADVLGMARTFMTDGVGVREVAEYCRSAGHLWAIVCEDCGTRTLVCARCRATEDREAAGAPTEGEVEDGVFDSHHDAIADRIAP
jgi:hypothetical protein